MTVVMHIGLGLVPVALGWLLLRRLARAEGRRMVAVLLDAAPAILGWAAFLGLSARPLFAGLLVFALAAGLAFADKVKRAVLREPVVFADMSELPQLFTHPELYLPFAGEILVIGGAIAILAALAAVFYLEPPLWFGRIEPAAATVLALGGLWLGVARQPLLGRVAAWLRGLGPSGDPAEDGRKIGPLASLFVHGIIARAERRARQAQVRPPLTSATAAPPGRPMPCLLIVQCESFFDARLMHPGIAPHLLEGFDRACREGAASGRLEVPGWGANTLRTEFSVLTGLGDEALGFDRFNPYHAFARVPVASLAWRLRAQGYRTICLHPFDRRFFRRDLVMPNLGFDEFIGIEGFGRKARGGGYVSDGELGDVMLDLVANREPGLMIFAMTMENHGPWRAKGPPLGDELAPGIAADAHYTALRRYLAGLRKADAMLAGLTASLGARGEPAVLAFYGDHLPSLPAYFDEFAFADGRTDYLLWRSSGGAGARRDLRAHELPALILDALREETMAAAPRAIDREPSAPAA